MLFLHKNILFIYNDYKVNLFQARNWLLCHL